MSDPTVLITGATDGLGRALALKLAGQGAHLILHGRDPHRLEQTSAEVTAASPDREPPRTFLADFSEIAQVARLVDQVTDAVDHLDVLVNNAGIGSGAPELTTRQQSRDGFELRFAINYLAGFRLTLGVLPLLRGSAPARVVLVASRGQHPLDFDDLQITRDYSGQRAYGQSKLAQIMFGFELAGRVPAAEVTANSLHPSSYMPTKMVMQNIGYSIDPLEQGREATARLVSDPALDGVSGRFFNVEKEARPDAQALDASARGLLWNRSLELVGITDPLG